MIQYLTHKLKPYGKFGHHFDFKCEICNVCLFQSSNTYFYLINNDGSTFDVKNFLLTCNEWIIKNIID